MAMKHDWHHQVEYERIPTNKVYSTDDGKVIRIEYREEDGKIYKMTKTYRQQTVKVLLVVAERKKWKKFGDAANDHPGINTSTTKLDDEIKMQFISIRDNDKQDEIKIIKEAISSLGRVKCRLCNGEHWTSKCAYKDSLQSPIELSNDRPNDAISISNNDSISKVRNIPKQPNKEASVGIWVSPSARRAIAGTRSADDQGRSPQDILYTSKWNNTRKHDESTVRVTNLPEETQEQDLRDLFSPFGTIHRVYLAKDKTNTVARGFAFITFTEKKDAQNAIDCVSGYGYFHLILKVEWANKSQH